MLGFTFVDCFTADIHKIEERSCSVVKMGNIQVLLENSTHVERPGRFQLKLCEITGGHVREKSGKFDFCSRSGKSQGILQIGQGNFKYQESQGKVREFHNFGPKHVL